MKTKAILVLALIGVGVVLSLHVTYAQQTGIKRTDLIRSDISTPGRETSQVRVDFAAGASFGRHSHPGEEHAYVLEGAFLVGPLQPGGGVRVWPWGNFGISDRR